MWGGNLNDEPVRTAHLSATDVAAYLSGRAGADSRVRIQAHLAECADCREEAIGASRILGAEHRSRSTRRVLLASVGLAAVLALVIVTRTAPVHSVESATRGTAGGASAESKVSVVGPLGGFAQAGGIPTFVWRSIPGAMEYRFTLTDVDGKVLWTRATPDTLLTPPLDVPLGTERAYYWFVDALLADGNSVTSGAKEFHIGR